MSVLIIFLLYVVMSLGFMILTDGKNEAEILSNLDKWPTVIVWCFIPGVLVVAVIQSVILSIIGKK